jgi:hypothetical protein
VLLLAAQLGPEGARTAGIFASASWTEQQDLARSSMPRNQANAGAAKAAGGVKKSKLKKGASGAGTSKGRGAAAKPAARSAADQAKTAKVNLTNVPKNKSVHNTTDEQHTVIWASSVTYLGRCFNRRLVT